MDAGTVEQVYRFGDYSLDAVRRTLTRNGATVALTAKSFDTLLFLIRNRGTTVTKHQIMDAVWPDTTVEENNLTQQISTLRKMLGELPREHRFIVTVPGHGYCFIAEVTNRKRADTGSAGFTMFQQLAVGMAVLLMSITIALLMVAASRSPRPTLAVLAFHSATGQEDALGAGLRYTLTAKLGTLHDVVDIRPTGALPHADPLIAGRELAVDAVVDGTIQHDGSQIRVTVQMVDVHGGRVLWGKSIDADGSQGLVAQDAVANEVVSGLTDLYARY